MHPLNGQKAPLSFEGKILNHFSLAVFFTIAIFPIIFSILFSLIYSIGLYGFFGTGLNFEYFARIFTSSEILPAFILSSYVGFISTFFIVLIALFLSLYFGASIKSGRFSFALYIPLILPSAVGALFIYLLLSDSGLVARLLLSLGLIEQIGKMPALVNDRFAIGIILTHVGLGVPFFTILFSQIREKARLNEVEQLCQSLGASHKTALHKIIIPIILFRAKPQILLSFIFVFGSFEIPAILGRHTPEMISVLAVRKMGLFDIAQKPEAFVVAFLYSLVVVGLLLAFYRRGNSHAG